MQLVDTGRKAAVDSVEVPFHQFPLLRAHVAARKGVSNNLLFLTWGGIGDVICSEPTIRHAIQNFKECKITVATHNPEIFAHLKELGLHDIYNLRIERPITDDYLMLQTIPDQGAESLTHQFLTHMHTHCVDFPALSALRAQLPLEDRCVSLKVPKPENPDVLAIAEQRDRHVIIHAGRHWKSKTFPAQWWNKVIDSICDAGFKPVLIGKENGETQGYVKTKKENCVDFRDKTTVAESIWLLQNSGVLVCNDSSPLHMAVTGQAWIGLIASVKRPEFIMHYRKPFPDSPPVWAWRQKDFSCDGFWNYTTLCPNRTTDLNLDECSPELIDKVLPDPNIFGPWCQEAMNDYLRNL